jgi:(p)ppGpp synthase/HD superfamily hydrolase
MEVASLVESVGGTEAMVAAALLHDVLEDTGVTVDVLEEQFGSEVADLVLWLTDVSKPDDGNRSTRKALDRQHSAAAPAAAQTVKVADLISNTRSIVAHDPGFAKVYLEEKRLLLDVLTRADPTLLTMAREQVG